MTTELRNANLAEAVQLLRDEQTRKIDVIAPAAAIRAQGANLVLQDTEPQLTPDGVTTTHGTYTPTDTCDTGLADKLGIPLAYLRRLRTDHPDLYDANINGWLDNNDKNYMVRALRPAGDHPGIARAFLSSRYRVIDNLDVLMAALKGIRDAGVAADIDGCDISERRMYVRVKSTDVAVAAPTLLKNYRSPFTGQTGADCPLMFAGFVITNSEVGAGAFAITPRITVQVCNNGMTYAHDGITARHSGARLDEGVIDWSNNTQDRHLDLITAQTTDSVRAFLSPAYLQGKVDELERQAARPIDNPTKAVEVISQRARFSETVQETILAHFIKAGDTTAGGLMNAVTSAAQTTTADTAADMESYAISVLNMELA